MTENTTESDASGNGADGLANHFETIREAFTGAKITRDGTSVEVNAVRNGDAAGEHYTFDVTVVQ